MSCPHRCRDRQVCKHVCCKQEETAEEKITGTICHERAVAAREARKLREALVWARKGIDEHVSQLCISMLRMLDYEGMRLSQEERCVLTESGEASDAFFSGHCLLFGRFGFRRDRAAGYRRFCVAALKHHAVGINYKGHCLRYGYGVATDKVTALQCFEQVSHLGCATACLNAGVMLRDGEGVAMDTHRAAVYFRRGAALGDTYCADRHVRLLERHPQEVAPWSRWRPDADVHTTQLEGIHRSQMTMLMVSRRIDPLRPVRLMILRFISTRG